ncbi:MAG: hypothetical protein JXJ22_03935 [Bacteroidales bacterium]|nr:hypothetical protein [Bacteroidales bacterium]
MKILYAIQGTGNGHLSRAREIIPLLQKKCEVDILVSGTQADITLPFNVTYRFNGLSFIFGKKGGVDVWNTYIKANTKKLKNEIKSLPIKNYDFVINDFEPVSAWAAYLNKIPSIALSHQAAILNKNAPKPKKPDLLGRFILKNYAPASAKFGFHFSKYAKNIYTPVIRKEVRELRLEEKDHYTVYLPSYDDESLINYLREFKDTRWQIFSKYNKKIIIDKNIEIYPISHDAFIHSMASAQGVLCGAGFETPAEAMFLGKKLMVIPMKTQYEQQCNAAALKAIGVPVIPKLKKKYAENISEWIESDYKIEIYYPDITEKIINTIFESYVQDILKKNLWDIEYELKVPKSLAKEIVKTSHNFANKRKSG